MAQFIRSKVKAGGYTNISEVVRTAVRRMQEEEVREARLARLAADEILDELTDADKDTIRERVHAGFAAIERGEYTDYVGREGLGNLAAGVKSRGRKLLAGAAPKA
jgi:putative addiction module CopG family antidote